MSDSYRVTRIIDHYPKDGRVPICFLTHYEGDKYPCWVEPYEFQSYAADGELEITEEFYVYCRNEGIRLVDMYLSPQQLQEKLNAMHKNNQ